MTAHGSPDRVPLDALLEHRDFLRALARRLVADENDADDVEQETWRMAVERPPHRAESLRGWLTAVVRNAARGSGRRRARRLRHEAAAPSRDGVPSPADLVAEAELQARLARAVLELDEPYRSAVLYRFREGLEASEIAARFGVPVETVRTRIKRGVERLRERMGVEIGDDRDAWSLLLLGARSGNSGSGCVLPLSGGGIAMAAGTKIAAAVVLVAAGATWWFAGRDVEPPAAPSAVGSTSTATSAVAAAPPPARVRSAAVSEPPAAAPHRLQGHVVDAGGRAAPGVRVLLLPEKTKDGRSPDVSSAAATASEFRETRTGADGAFAADPLAAPGVASAVALADDGAMGVAPKIRPGEDVVIALSAPASLAGRVTDTAGVAVADALVRVGCLIDTASLVRETHSAADGTYRVAGIPAAPAANRDAFTAAQVEFSADGFAPSLVPVLSQATRFAPGEERRLDARLVRGAVLTGVVVEAESGAPVGGASVALVSEEGRTGFSLARGRGVENPFAPRTVATAVTGADGRFRVEHVPVAGADSSPSRLGVVRVQKDGYGAGEADVRCAADGTSTDVRVALRRAATISGRVVDRAGKPVAGLMVWARIGEERNDVRATTGADGRYRLERFPAPAVPATAVVHAFRTYEDRDQFAAQNSHADVSVRAGDDAVAPDLVWNFPDWPVVTYVVVDETGAPVRDARVESAGDEIRILTCDDAGRAEQAIRPFPAEYPKPWPSQRWIVRAPGRAPSAVTVPPEPADGQEFRVVLRAGRRVAGRVLGPDGAPRANVFVRALDPAVPVAAVFESDRRTSFDSLAHDWPGVPFLGTTRSGDDGSFALDDLPDGPFTVGAWTGGAGEWATLAGVLGGATDVELRLPDADAALASLGARVVLVVKDEQGAPVAARALATGAGGAVWSGPDTTTRGTTAFVPLPAGTWRLEIDVPGFVPWTKDGVVVEKGRAADPIEAVLRRGATVAGRVTLPDGATFGGRAVLLITDSGGVATAPLAADGTFRATGFAAGRYRVAVAPAQWWAEPNPSFAAVGDATVVVAADAGEFRADVRCVPAGAIAVELTDRRLPVSGNGCDDAKWRFGAESSAEIRDAAGAVVHSRHGLTRVSLFRNLVLPAGRYTLRVACPGSDAVEQAFEVVAGKTASLSVGAK